MSFTPATLTFFRGLKLHNAKPWFEAHRADYDAQVVAPMRAIIEEMDVRLARFAPEITGHPKRSMFRIYRDVRFSKDKSPYKTNAGCWFWHRDADPRVGDSAEGGGAGFYFHLQPGSSFTGGGIWMPPRPLLNKLRDAIAEGPKGFARVAKGLDDDYMLKRMPRGYAEDHPAARWLKFTSFVAGGDLTDKQITSPKLAATLETHFKRLLPLVRWLNGALGLRAATRR